MIKPVNDAHSIKAVAFILEFDKEIEKDGLDVVSDAYKRFRKKLLLKRVIRRFNINLNFFEGHAPSPDTVGGYRFFTKAKDDTEEAWFEISSNRAVYCTTNYIDFKSFLAEALYYAEVSASAFGCSNASLVKVGIEYRDEFVSETISWPVADLINVESPYLSRAAVKEGDFWHSHCGTMTVVDLGRRLDVLKVEHIQVADTEREFQEYKLVIVLTHIMDVAPFPLANVEHDVETRAFLEKIVVSLRVAHKQILTSVLSPKMIVTIGLDS